jgi:hypothetical protein
VLLSRCVGLWPRIEDISDNLEGTKVWDSELMYIGAGNKLKKSVEGTADQAKRKVATIEYFTPFYAQSLKAHALCQCRHDQFSVVHLCIAVVAPPLQSDL